MSYTNANEGAEGVAVAENGQTPSLLSYFS